MRGGRGCMDDEEVVKSTETGISNIAIVDDIISREKGIITNVNIE